MRTRRFSYPNRVEEFRNHAYGDSMIRHVFGSDGKSGLFYDSNAPTIGVCYFRPVPLSLWFKDRGLFCVDCYNITFHEVGAGTWQAGNRPGFNHFTDPDLYALVVAVAHGEPLMPLLDYLAENHPPCRPFVERYVTVHLSGASAS